MTAKSTTGDGVRASVITEAVASATLSSDFPPEHHALGIRLRRRDARNG